jgi:hypothetical protein
MLNSDPAPNNGAAPPDETELDAILRSGAIGAMVLAGLATATVIAMGFVFYLLVFLPRAVAS